MATKAGRRAGTAERTVLVVDVGEEGAETLLAELASRGFPAAVLRGEQARQAAGLASDSTGDAGSSFSEDQIRLLLASSGAFDVLPTSRDPDRHNLYATFRLHQRNAPH